MTRRFNLFEYEVDVLHAVGNAANLEVYVSRQGTIMHLGSTSPSLLLDEIEDLNETPDEAFLSNINGLMLRRFAFLTSVVIEGNGYFHLNKSILFIHESSGRLYIQTRQGGIEVGFIFPVKPVDVAAELNQHGFTSTML